ncbi:NADH:flavin oxidoreductase/NADH oxidase domain-containing protein [Cavenderia fasciculata]|uniref:NADH:flavin oxidoreductase/NADH oxidase domain-containing protein n=1 Tax=Cavenderia fasciculata TaxID=261658 RepID=F4PNZ6_CACFS|nr:NADH:flavin oxidoreductase/NADH oxidase domain-containing protein [Cavenderia fasciculata]EGG22675.1 NADH:flavin oxidoreductase/NADH oxidase domain-containing protein [Cavenderia fasciculata]|eukprot:XP_004360526.1 NADH:flavin oxidoreductase/NADH oxidase domain-containing protein [Cavenderia fasciculata]
MPKVLQHASTLIKGCKELNVPIIGTEQYPQGLGHIVDELDPKSYPIFSKTLFSMCTPDVQNKLKEFRGLKSVIITGIETHVCVLQTTLDLLESGYDVHIVEDAVSSQRLNSKLVALERLKQSGAFITTTESILFQLAKDAKHPNFKKISTLVKSHNDAVKMYIEEEREREASLSECIPEFKNNIYKSKEYPNGYQSAGIPSIGKNEGKHIPLLFTPLKIRNVEFKNRIVVSPMCQYSSTDGFMNDWHLVHLGTFAKGGAGLVMFEASGVTANGRITALDAGIYKDEHVGPMKRIVDFVHQFGAKAGLQIAHAGRKASTCAPFLNTSRLPANAEQGGWTNVDAPSPIPWAETFPKPAGMTIDEIRSMEDKFVDAAKRAEQAGFDVIEIHAAHGYLISEFLSGTSNKRTDDYGGSLENRSRFLYEIVRKIRKVYDGVLFVRISCSEWVQEEGAFTPEDSIPLAKKLKELGVDLLDCSSGGNNPRQHVVAKPLYQVPFADLVKKNVPNFLTAAVGLIETAEEAEQVLQQQSADLVMLARPFLRDPFWPVRAAIELDISIDYCLQYQMGQPRPHGQAGGIPR